MSSTQFVLPINVLRRLMIGEQHEFLLNQVVTPMFQCLYDGIKFEIIRGVVLLGIGELRSKEYNKVT